MSFKLTHYLLTNASKFTARSGRIWLRVESRATVHGTEAVVYVCDDGIGIDAKMLPHVFDLFQQGGASPHRASGLGIGLALVRRIVELHGGRVQVRSAGVECGSEFEICLPLIDDTVEAPQERITDSSSAAVVGQRILVVDDNVDGADSLAALLQVWGHEVHVAHDGAAALEIAPAFAPTLVFLDIGMPAMDGYEVARRLRRLPGFGHAALVALTGLGSNDDRQRAEQAGFDRHITKPVDPAVLRTVIAEHAAERSI